MNKGFDWTGFKMGDFVVYCRNRNEIRQFLEECDKQGLRWASGGIKSYNGFRSNRVLGKS